MILVVEELLFFGDDEEDGGLPDVGGVFDGRELKELLADGRADEAADGDGAGRGPGVAVGAAGGFGMSLFELRPVGADPAPVEGGDLRDDGPDARLARRDRRACRTMFSTTTMASSTRMPMEKISANSETRLSVKPQAQDANSVTVSVRITALPTMAASRRPSEKNTSTTTEAVANISFWISLLALSVAVAP